MTTTIVTPDHDAGICQTAFENRKQLLSQLKCLAEKLDRCEKLFAGCAKEKPSKPLLITHPQYPRYPEDIPRIRIKPGTTPPWVVPRSKSRELIGSDLKVGCQCIKRNGLQDDCERLQCRGQDQCLTKPEPTCPPSGAWKKYATPEEAKMIINIGNRRPQVCENPALSKEARDVWMKHSTHHHNVQYGSNEESVKPQERCHRVTIPIDIVVRINRDNNKMC